MLNCTEFEMAWNDPPSFNYQKISDSGRKFKHRYVSDTKLSQPQALHQPVYQGSPQTGMLAGQPAAPQGGILLSQPASQGPIYGEWQYQTNGVSHNHTLPVQQDGYRPTLPGAPNEASQGGSAAQL